MTDDLLAAGGAAGGGAALAWQAGKLLKAVVGPTAEVVGEVFAEWADIRLRNFLKISTAADELIDPDSDGSVHPQVLNRILADGAWCDDDVTQRYSGGVLAASRTKDGREQRGAYYANILAFMTPEQVRLHHIIYSALAQSGLEIEYSDTVAIKSAGLLFSIPALEADFPGDATATPENLIAEAASALDREGLVNGQLVGGSSDFERVDIVGVSEGSRAAAFFPSNLGILLYLWGCGVRTGDPNRIKGRPPILLKSSAPMVAPTRVGRFYPEL
ncbi:hypothetical protein J8M97_18370 [Gordonia polyisoprenivorans]|uniref:hypothetical protein n=1 Tax=Gordonia polyisoprenivorans TaxID=84595 RepID=UPI001B8D3A06|nr:hypothetical protein [Gordonia polyisoprenivorans]QUD81720.1 hypothetical protein J8M97_18370 [Gordonia polyisoprenivorans]